MDILVGGRAARSAGSRFVATSGVDGIVDLVAGVGAAASVVANWFFEPDDGMKFIRV